MSRGRLHRWVSCSRTDSDSVDLAASKVDRLDDESFLASDDREQANNSASLNQLRLAQIAGPQRVGWATATSMNKVVDPVAGSKPLVVVIVTGQNQLNPELLE